MDVGFTLRSEAVGAMRSALVSAENLQLTLRTELSQEEQALTQTKSSPKETNKAGYCSNITLSSMTGDCFFYFFFLTVSKETLKKK